MNTAVKEVQVIKATITGEKTEKIRVAAYCRVSTDKDDQLNLFFAQMRYPDKYKGEIAESYKKAFLRNRSNLLPFVFKHDLVRAVAILAESGKITAENYETQYLACMQRANAVKSAAYLLDWVNANITEEQREKAFEKQLEEDPYNPADMRKLWKYEEKEDGIHIIKYKGKDPEVYYYKI